MSAVDSCVNTIIGTSVDADAIMGTALQNEANSTLIKCEIVGSIGGITYGCCLRPTAA